MEKELLMMKVDVNCRNLVFLSGYPDKIVYYSEDKDDKSQHPVLRFRLNVLNEFEKLNAKTGKTESIIFNMQLWVEAKHRRAEEVKKWIKKFVKVDVEGKLRVTERGKEIIAVFISPAKERIMEVEFDITEKEVTK
jgi:hypothetical protein